MATKAVKIDYIMKVADISSLNVTPELITFLQTYVEPTYRDNVLKEHLYNIQDLAEQYAEGYEMDDPEEKKIEHWK